jgi:hypothetical protein
MLALVAALAPAIALYARLVENVGADLDLPTVTLLAIVLTGIAVGAWRRASPVQVIVQIGLTCALLTARIEIDSTRLANYWLALVVAVTIVLPLLARAQAGTTQGSRLGSPRAAWAGAVLVNVALNLSALIMFFSLNSLMMNGRFEISILQRSVPYTLPAGKYLLAPPEVTIEELSVSGGLPPTISGASPMPSGPQPADNNEDSQKEHP